MSLPCMIFAAGFGRRMGALTKDRPKPLLPIGGATLLDHAINVARAAGAGPIVVNSHYLGAHIAAHLTAHWPDVLHSPEPDQILDTGGGLKHAAPLLGAGSHVFTLNADILWGPQNPLLQLATDWKGGSMQALLLAGDSQRLGRALADFQMDKQGRLQRGAVFPGHTYLGAQIVARAAVMQRREAAFSLNAVWDDLAAGGHLYGTAYADQWDDLGTAAQYEAAKAALEGTNT